MADAPRILIGSEDSEHLLIEPIRYERPEAADYWDGNWVHALVRIRTGAFHGEYEAQLRTDEFAAFRPRLANLYERLSGAAIFETLEHGVRIDITGDGRGHFTATCEARDEPGTGSRLTFLLAFDQTDLPAMLRDLDELVRQFPVRGSPGEAR